MKEKLIIRNFGPIKEVDLDLGKVTVLIGEQATGKSTVAKVLAVCRYFSYIIGEKGNAEKNYHVGTFEEGLVSWGLNESIKQSSFIKYECFDYLLQVVHQDAIIESSDIIRSAYGFHVKLEPKSDRFKNLLLELDKIKPTLRGVLWTIPTSFYLNDVKNVMDNPFYLPTERGLQSIFDIGQSSIRNLSNSLFNQFSRLDGIARLFKKETYIEPLDIYYVNRDGHGFIRKASEEQYYSLYNAASGYQSTIPIVLVVIYYTEIRKKKKTLLIEEPELNLFPTAQDKLMQYLVDKAVSNENSILVTTQSPYVQTSLNNMMYAHQVGQKKQDDVSGVIDKKYWLDPKEVSAYRLLKDGTVKDILDKELQQIDAGEIDEVSREINSNWDKLANIEYNKTDEN